MRTTLLLSSILLLVIACSSTGANKGQEPDRPLVREHIRYNFSGDPFMKINFEYRPDGRLLHELYWDSTGAGIRIREKIYTYYENDTLVEKAEMIDGGHPSYTVHYHYNDEKLLIREEYHDGEVYRWREYDYDKQRRVVAQRDWDAQFGGSNVEYTYTEAGEVETAVSYGDEGNIQQQNRWYYTDDTLLTELLFLDGNDSIVRRWTYDYDQDGRKIREKEVQPDGTIFILKEWAYNEDGKVIKEESHRYRIYLKNFRYTPEGRLREEVEYDNMGRLTMRSFYE